MSRAKSPVVIGGVEFDALLTSDMKIESTVPDYVTELGFNVTDSIILGAETLDMKLFLTDTPVTWYGRHGSGHTNSAEGALKDIFYNKDVVTVHTSERAYDNMGIVSMTISKSTEIGYAKEVQVSFKKIRVTEAKTTTIPDSYKKSGTSGKAAGTASTKTDSIPDEGGRSDYSYLPSQKPDSAIKKTVELIKDTVSNIADGGK